MRNFAEVGNVIDAPIDDLMEYFSGLSLPEHIGIKQLLERELVHVRTLQHDFISNRAPLFSSWTEVGTIISLYVIEKSIIDRISLVQFYIDVLTDYPEVVEN